MILDIGASEKACRGHICLIYKYDTSLDRHLSQYDPTWKLIDGEKIYYSDFKELIKLVERYSNENTIALMVHSLEHMDCPYDILNKLYENKVKELHIYVPNAKENDADWKDMSHVYSFTQPSLLHLLERIFIGYKINVEYTMGYLDLYGYAISSQ
jgi:hypothetical protein